ncbi:MAG TPA: tripartite tricarboxylate transporter substrate-binding protein [Xanthobacteraceae bacterium]|nr:tripartite tricarboxylate transporter substrate-binding protein [Xanthobacteraceae bacterium]
MNAGCKVVTGMLFAAMCAAASAALAEAAYPNRPVTLLVPYGAGGVADVGMRILGDQLSNRLKQQFVIENRPGAAGIVAAQAGAAAAPDGYTLLMTGNNNAIAVALFKSLPYNILTDFASISTAAFFDLLIVTRGGSPLKSLADVIAAAKANPGKLNIGTINPGSTQNLAAELFTSTAGIKAAIVPFRTSPDMAGAVMRGDIDVAFEFYAAISGLLADHKILALASTGLKRTAYLPDVPTVMESGIKDYDVASWNGLSAPAATPKPVIATLNAAMKDVIPGPDVQSKSNQMGMAMRWSTPDDMTARMQADIAKWGAVIEKAGIARHE